MGDREEIEEKRNVERRKVRYQKFVAVEEILAEWTQVHRVPGGTLCTMHELYRRLKEKSSSLLSSLEDLADFISSHPHLFRRNCDTVRVNIREERERFIRVVRFVHDASNAVSVAELKQKFNDEIRERGEMTRNSSRDPFRTTVVWTSIGRRNGEGVFSVDGDSISLTPEALLNESFFDDIYLNYNDEVVRRQQLRMEAAVEGEETVRKQIQCNSTQVTLLGMVEEVKQAYMKAVVVSARFHGETVYIMPNQIGEDNIAKFHEKQMLLIRCHDVVGDQDLKNRFRADEIMPFPVSQLKQTMRPEPTLSYGHLDCRVPRRVEFPTSLWSETGMKEGHEETQATELARLIAKCGSGEGVERGLSHEEGEEFSDYPPPTKEMEDEFIGRSAYEKFIVDELDGLIRCGIKNRKELGEATGDEYPLSRLLIDVQNRSLSDPDCIPIMDKITMEGVYDVLMQRPHLYQIVGGDSCPSVLLHGNRSAVDRLLRCLDRRMLWSYSTLRESLDKGEAGQEWEDQWVEEMVYLLSPLLSIQDEFFALAARRSREGLWMRDETAMRRGTKRGEGRGRRGEGEESEEEESEY
ncbi:hypothetical protein PFISCL1PPCAC_6727 [Pristionchus fissidentatus]|uniref:Uncharacterized protein n=1 Tax=Pristionchus fissidentatus TaxID=1538716 RepID=A0AAV5VA47_9BILA|nr:hypothetical protein PFISCL1PPCAC_6727 [Pristionchus fissidentatus]